jgi:hypothetical protein
VPKLRTPAASSVSVRRTLRGIRDNSSAQFCVGVVHGKCTRFLQRRSDDGRRHSETAQTRPPGNLDVPQTVTQGHDARPSDRGVPEQVWVGLGWRDICALDHEVDEGVPPRRSQSAGATSGGADVTIPTSPLRALTRRTEFSSTVQAVISGFSCSMWRMSQRGYN